MKEIVISNGLYSIITQTLEEMKSEQGNSFRLEEVNLSELERRTKISIYYLIINAVYDSGTFPSYTRQDVASDASYQVAYTVLHTTIYLVFSANLPDITF